MSTSAALSALNNDLDAELARQEALEDDRIWQEERAKLLKTNAAVAQRLADEDAKRQPVPLPPLRELRDEDLELIAKTRGLDVRALRWAARERGRIWFSEWPMWKARSGVWISPCQEHFFRCSMNTPGCVARERWPSWCLTDGARRVAEFRRLDNEKYPRQSHDALKAWSTAGKSWPVGMGDAVCRNILLTEGGPDHLAAFHFLFKHWMLEMVSPVTMLGASNKIADDALWMFRGTRVRIVVQADEVKELVPAAGSNRKPRKTRAAYDAALRWQEQLTAAGAAVECFYLEGLTRADGVPVNDLNDLALCSEDVLGSDEIGEAFTEWRF